jgi:hypothetical protein
MTGDQAARTGDSKRFVQGFSSQHDRVYLITACCAVDSVFFFPLTIVDSTVKYVVALGARLLECFRRA